MPRVKLHAQLFVDAGWISPRGEVRDVFYSDGPSRRVESVPAYGPGMSAAERCCGA